MELIYLTPLATDGDLCDPMELVTEMFASGDVSRDSVKHAFHEAQGHMARVQAESSPEVFIDVQDAWLQLVAAATHKHPNVVHADECDLWSNGSEVYLAPNEISSGKYRKGLRPAIRFFMEDERFRFEPTMFGW